MLLLLLGCADTWIQRPYACEHATLDWWEPDPAWLVAQAAEGEDGTWQFDAPSGYAATDHTEGYWEPSAGRFGYTQFAVEASSHARVDMNSTGTIAPNGDLDLVTEAFSYDDLGFFGAWTETTTRRACVTERVAVTEGETDANVYTSTFVDDDTVAGTYTYAPAGYDATYAETSTTTRDLTRTAAGGWSDGSYVEERESRADGATDMRWEDHTEEDRGWVAFGDEHFALDGSRESTTRDEVDGVVVRTCTLALSYAGEGTATCYEPATDLTCTYAYGPEACNYVCDDGDGGEC
jgi:hypothetical protein